MSTAGYSAHPTLDGTQLVGVSPVDFEITVDHGLVLQRLATGRFRKTLHFTDAGLPDVQVIHGWMISYTRLSRGAEDPSYLDFVDWQISRPGLHTFTDWKFKRLTWTVTLGQVEFALPWRVANFHVDFPAEDPTGARLQPIITVDPVDEAQRFVVIPKTTVEYDAETPSAGEAFLDQEGTRFKVGDALAEGSVVFSSLVPLFNVFLTVETARRLVVGKEGRVLVIQEM